MQDEKTLDSELRTSLIETTMIDHPLLTLQLSGRETDATLRALIRVRREELHESRLCGDWKRYVFLHRPRDRPTVLLSLSSDLAGREFYSLAGEVWTDPAMPIASGDFLLECFARKPSLQDRAYLMTEAERKSLDELPDVVRVFRSHGLHNDFGICWSVSSQTVRLLGEAYGYTHISSGYIKKADAIAFIARRQQAEVIVTPTSVYDFATIEISDKWPCIPFTEKE